MHTRAGSAVCALVVLFALSALVEAGPPWTSLLPFKRVPAEESGDFSLSDKDGPWLILAANFSGSGAEEQAQELVLEIRRRYRLPAYVHRENFDFSDSFDGISHTGAAKRMRYAQDSRYEAIAVLIGDFPSIDDPGLEKTLQKIKYARPDCLDLAKRETSTQRFVGLRELYRRINADESKRKKGPMGSAFATRNPMLPRQYFEAERVDSFVVGLNKGVKYSLLKNRGKVTVKVASFSGESTINMSKIAAMQSSGSVSNKLEVAADQAHRLTDALRNRKVEAYEYHTRHESIVTVGSFDAEGTPLPNGAIEINPEIHKVMQEYGAKRQSLPGRPDLGLQPRSLDGIPFDIQPVPMAVPQSPATSISLNPFR